MNASGTGERGAITASRLGACVHMHVCARVCARMRACACVCACVSACLHDVFAIYDNNISPRLIMIIIQISILY